MNATDKRALLFEFIHAPPSENFVGETLKEANNTIYIHTHLSKAKFNKFSGDDCARLLLAIDKLLHLSKAQANRSSRFSREAKAVTSTVQNARDRAASLVVIEDGKASRFLANKLNKKSGLVQDEKGFDPKKKHNEACPHCGHFSVIVIKDAVEVKATNDAIEKDNAKKVFIFLINAIFFVYLETICIFY
jgi:hypothetical protein